MGVSPPKKSLDSRVVKATTEEAPPRAGLLFLLEGSMDLKACTKCKVDRPIDFFSRKSGNTRHSWCKECYRAYHRSHYRADPKSYQQQAAARKKRIQLTVRALKDMQPCVDCGVAYPWYVMQFDHLPSSTKLGHVSVMSRDGTSEIRLKEEIAKCEIVCANCHATRTHGRRTCS